MIEQQENYTTTDNVVQREPQQQKPQQESAPKKMFSRGTLMRPVEVNIHFPKLYPDIEPFGFKMRMKLSVEAEERRQQYLSLSAAEATLKITDQALDEVCDLLTELPSGFGDLKYDGSGPGSSFRTYYESVSNPETKEFLRIVIEGADSAYWNAIAPREFRKQV